MTGVADREAFRILVVEDSPTQARGLEILLCGRGFQVTVAANGREGIERARRFKPDMIVSDINMPEMNGYEMCRFTRQDPDLCDVPVILLTTLTDPKDVVMALNVSADCYISKPYNPRHLLAKIDQLLAVPGVRKKDKPSEKLDIDISGERFTVTSNRSQILTLLISIYEDTVTKNRELIRTKEALEDVNEALNGKLNELQVSENRFRALVNTIPDIVYRVDPEGRFAFLNEAIGKLGYTPEELMGKHFSQIILPADLASVSRREVLPKLKGSDTGGGFAPKLFDERRTGSRKTTGLEVRLVPKKGKRIEPGYIEALGEDVVVVEVNSSGMYDGNEGTRQRLLIGTVGVIRDITDRKLIEEELRKSYDELEAKVRLRTHDLRTVNQTLRRQVAERERAEKALQKTLADLKQSQAVLIETEKIAALGTLTAGVAHELNNPLMGIMNFIEYCLDKTPPDDRRHEILRDADREVRRCIQIVQNLLTFSRIKRESEEEFQPESCDAILDRVIRLLSYRIEKDGVKITRTVAADTPEIMMRVSNIQQVFVNTIGNALDALRGCPDREIHVDIAPEGDFVRIEISDTGSGVSPEDMPRIFDPFFTTKPVGQGTGLGLSISKGIIKSHRGEMTCTSRPGAGTTFQMVLPIKQLDNKEV